MSLLDFSSGAFIAAFFLYCFGFMFYAVCVGGQRWSNRKPEEHIRRWGRIAYFTSSACICRASDLLLYTLDGGGHIPTSNMYEFMSFLAMAIMLAFFVVHAIYRKPLLGLFTLPLTVIIVAFAAVFPQEVQPLIPALQSGWLVFMLRQLHLVKLSSQLASLLV